MICLSCNSRLTSFEATRKSKTTGEYIDLCNRCFSHIEKEVPTIIRKDLMDDTQDRDEEWYEADDARIDWDDK